MTLSGVVGLQVILVIDFKGAHYRAIRQCLVKLPEEAVSAEDLVEQASLHLSVADLQPTWSCSWPSQGSSIAWGSRPTPKG